MEARKHEGEKCPHPEEVRQFQGLLVNPQPSSG